MTDERKNEIWAMIPKEEQIEFQKAYDTMYECESYDMGFKDALERVFGYRNLTAQAEEKCTNPTENCISDPKIQSESAKSVETSTKEDAYFAYRLDLAKEIAVAVIRSDRWDFKSCDPVEQANEIVKRLKETEE